MRPLLGIGFKLRVLIPHYSRLGSSKASACPLIWTFVIALAGAFSFASHAVGASPLFAKTSDASPPSIDDLFRKWGAVYGVDWQLLRAIAVTESRLNPDAVNTADKESIGLMQVLCRPDGEGGCSNRLNVDGWSEATRKKLFDPRFNIRIGTQILAWNIRTYGMPKAIAVYNRWAERTSPVAGPFLNNLYVHAVLDNDMRRTSIDSHGETRAQPDMLINRQLAGTFDLISHLKQTHGNATGAQFCPPLKYANPQTRGVPGSIIGSRHKLLCLDG